MTMWPPLTDSRSASFSASTSTLSTSSFLLSSMTDLLVIEGAEEVVSTVPRVGLDRCQATRHQDWYPEEAPLTPSCQSVSPARAASPRNPGERRRRVAMPPRG